MPKPSTTRHRRIVGASGAFVIALSIALGCVEIFFDHRKAMENAFERLETLARIADESVSGRIRTIDVMLQDVAREAQGLRGSQDEESLLAYMNARTASLEGVRTISVLDAAGRVTLTTLPAIKGLDGSQRPYFTLPREVGNRNRLVIQGPVKASTGAVVLFVSRAKPPVNGAWDGIVIASLPPAYFTSILESVHPLDDGFATLVGIEGTIIARSPDNGAQTGRNVVKGPAHIAHLESGQRITRTLVTTAPDGQRRLVVSRTTDFPELVVAVGWAEERVLADWRNRAMAKASVLCLLALIATLVLRRFTQHEGELLNQRNFAQQLIETANVMVIGLDRHGCVRVFNEAAERITGFTKAEILDRPWFETIAAGVCMTEVGAAFRAGKPLPRQFDGPVYTKNRQQRIVSWQNSTMPGQDIVTMAFGIDITDRLQAEREMIESQRFIQTVADNMPGMVGYWDRDRYCRFANRPYQEWYGRTADQIVGHHMLDLLGPSLLALNQPYIEAVLKGERQRFERVLTKVNGEVRNTWVHYTPDFDASGVVVGFFVMVTDITPLKTVENSLRTTSERLALAAKVGGFGVWDYDPGTKRLTWDHRMFQLYGLDPAATDHMYEMWRTRCLPEDLARVETELADAIHGRADFDSEFRIVTPDGALRHIKAAATAERDEDGAVKRVIGVNWDITAVRENAAALASARAVAEQASRAKSAFLANMSHEIRTPMNAILGLAHLLERTPLTAEQRDFAGKIKVAGQGLLSIINDILDFSKVEAGRLDLEMAEFQLPDLLDAISTIMSVNASTKDLELVIDLAPGTPTALVGDALRLQQVLINLTGNAIKFTEKGSVTLRAELIQPENTPGDAPEETRTDEAAAEDRVAEDDRAMLRFSIQDSGIGIPETALPALFDAFSQADSSTTRRYGGSGLGLAICKRLVELMGGAIGVESRTGQGSHFWFTVPLRRSTAPGPARPAAMRLDVLVADDHDIARKVIAGTAVALGWSTESAGSGHEALERVQDRLHSASPFDVLILDWEMPGMDGLVVSRIVHALPGLHETPIVIMVTAYNREVLLQTPGADLVDAILVKPVTSSSLYNAVMEARARRGGTTDALVGDRAPATVGPRLQQVRLLVVEDNGINQDVARRVLELEGAVVTIVADGRQALDRLAEDGAAFDAVLMDVQMPVMDGYEATRRIRRDLGLAALPVIALTAGALAEERIHAQQTGMDDFIPKPFDLDQMVQAIRRHVPLPGPAEPEMPVPPGVPAGSGVPTGSFSADLPGVDLRQASLRLGGDGGLFTTLLGRLVRDFADTVPRLRDQLAAGNSTEAAQRLHALRGAAGNVAAVDVAARAYEAEAAIRENRPEAMAALLDRLDDALGTLARSVRHNGTATADGGPPPASGQTPGQIPGQTPAPLPADDETLALVTALDARSMSALAVFDQLRPALAQALDARQFAELAHEIDELMFDAAARRLRGLLLTE